MRRLRRMLMWLGGVAIFLAAFGYWQWHLLLDKLQISELRADVDHFGLSRLQLGSLHFHLQVGTRILVLDLHNADVQWQWQGLTPYVTVVDLGELSLRVGSSTVQEQPSTTEKEEGIQLPDSWQLPDFFPQLITIEHAVLALPCGSGVCPVAGRFNSLRVNDHLKAYWVLADAPSTAQVNLSYDLDQELPQLSVSLQAPELFEAHLHMDLVNSKQLLWSGDVNAQIYRPSVEWQHYLTAWNARADFSWMEAIVEPMAVNARWQLDVNHLLALDSGLLNDRSVAGVLQSLRSHVDGSFVGELKVPSHLPIAGVGELSGQARIDLAISNRAITRYDLELDLNLDAPVTPTTFTQYELSWSSLQLEIQSQAATDVNLQALPLQLKFVAKGMPDASLSAKVLLNTESLSVQVENGLLDMSVDRWSPITDVNIESLKLQQAFAAQWHGLEQRLDYQLTSPGEVLLNLQIPDIRIHHGRIALDELALTVNPSDWQQGVLTAKGAIDIDELYHPSLNPKPWQWRGQIDAAAQTLQVQGLLVASGQLNVEHQLSLTPERVSLQWQLADVFLLAGEGLQQISPLWPPLLTLSRGRIGAQGNLHWNLTQLNPSPMPQVDAVVNLSGVTGLYDTTVFKGVTTKLNIVLKEDAMTLSSGDLSIEEIVQGFTLTKVQGAASYQASSAHIAAGVLTLTRLESGLLGGSLRVPAGVMDLSLPKQEILIELQELDLAQLLAEHPAGDLKGSGRISGRIPVEWSAAGLRVAQGTLAAQAPGGHLQYRSPGATQMAAGSQNMKIITDALDDFHYTLLNSDVSYDESGKLLLGVRLEGKNPAVEAGRPINFNINVEEDLPALIYSLQLTNQLNDIIKKRVQEKMRKKAVP